MTVPVFVLRCVIPDLLGGDVLSARVVVGSTAGSTVIAYPDGTVRPATAAYMAPGGSIDLPLPATTVAGANPVSHQWVISGEATLRVAGVVPFGPFYVTHAGGDLVSLSEFIDAPPTEPTWRDDFRDEMEGNLVAAEAARDEAEAILVADSSIALGDAEAALVAQIPNGATPIGGALSAAIGTWKPGAAYVKGDRVISPLGGESVVIEDHVAPDAWDDSKVLSPVPTVPSMTLYPQKQDVLSEVLYQHDATTLYKVSQNATGTLAVSTNRGQTWSALGDIGMRVLSMTRVMGTGTFIAVELTNRGATGQNPKVKRSTDGITWTQVTTLTHPGLGRKSIISPADGIVLIGEYGNTGSTVYRIMRSADDGLTWAAVLSSAGTDPASDPGHFHSIVKDPVAGTLIAFMDRGTPEIFTSPGTGASAGLTWTRLGYVTQQHHPNWVEPMFFESHIAWGNDNQADGRVFRLPRADFYAGNWARPEVVAQLNNDRFYDTFPAIWNAGDAAPSVWLMVGSTENVDRSRAGSFNADVFVVSGAGALVSGGVSHTLPSVNLSTVVQNRCQLPGHPAVPPDFEGQGWIGLPITDIPRPMAFVPYTVGRAPAMPVTGASPVGPIDLPASVPIRAADPTGVYREMITKGADGTVLIRQIDATGTLGEMRLSPTGNLQIYRSGVLMMQVSAGGIHLGGQVLYSTNTTGSASIQWGTGDPEGVTAGALGTLYVRTSGTIALFQRVTSGAGNTGWQQVGGRPPAAVTGNFTSKASGLNAAGKYAGLMAFNTTTARPVWATGSTDTATWVYADGTTAHTPA